MSIVVAWENVHCFDVARTFATQHQLSLCERPGLPAGGCKALWFTDKQVELVVHDEKHQSHLFCDFVTGPLGYRLRQREGKKQAIARALGLKKHCAPQVIDATAGLGQDAFVLAALGCRMRLIERSPIIAALLKDGLKRATGCEMLLPILHHMQLIEGDSIILLKGLTQAEYPDIVYLDPMFPVAHRSALNKLSMRVVRDIVGADIDSEALLRTALEIAKERVVVKRAKLAPNTGGMNPHFSIAGKSNRYDIYLTQVKNEPVK